MTFVIFVDFCFSLVGSIVESCKITWHSDKIIAIMKAVFEDSCSLAKKKKKRNIKQVKAWYNIRKHRITIAFHHILKLDSKNDK